LIALAVPNILLRRRGWRIAIGKDLRSRFFRRESWQFSIADILILVTGLAVVLGLQVGHRPSIFESVLIGGVSIIVAPVAVYSILSWRRMWLAALSSIAFGVLFTVIIDAATWHITWQSLLEIFSYIVAVFLVGLWSSLGWMRFVGYRMSVLAETHSDSPDKKS